MKNMMRISIMLCLVSIVLFLPTQRAFTWVETRTTSPQLYYVPMSQQQNFQFRYTHSIHLSDVWEYYTVEDNQIRLQQMTYTDTAIGMPAVAEEGQTLQFNDGLYTLVYEQRMLPNFTLYIGDVELDLSFYYEAQEFALKQTLNKGTSYMFSVKRISLYERLKGVRLS